MRARLWLPLAGALALVLWWALRPEGGGDRAVAMPRRDAAAGGASRPSQLAVGGVELDELEGERTLAGSAAPGVERPNAPNAPNTPGALLAGRVLFPAGAPPDESLAVVAFAAKPHELHPYSTIDQARLGTSFAQAVPFAVAPVAPVAPVGAGGAGGAFALELAEPRAELWLQVDGRFLALAQPVHLALPADGEILLRPALCAWIHGVVAGARDGQPVVLGADLAGSPADPERMGAEPLRVAFADAAGRYELRGVPAGGTWWIGTRAEGTALDHRRGLATARGGALEIDLASVPGAAVSGRVLHAAAPEEGVAGVLITAIPAAADELLGVAHLAPVAITEDGGAFTLGDVALGASRIQAREGLCTAEPLELDVRGDVADLVFALDPKSALTGRVLLPDGAPAAGADVRVVQRATRAARADAKGAFRIACLDAGARVAVSARLPAGGPGASDLEAKATAAGGEHVELVLAPAAASPVAKRTAPTLTGRVLAPDGAPVSGAEVYIGDVDQLRQEEGPPWLGGGSQARTDALGRFVVTGWTAAGLGVVARARGFAPSAIVPVDSGESLDVVLRAGGGLFGTVYDEAGTPQPRFLVQAFHRDGTDAAMASTDANGAFRFDALLPGNYVLAASPIPPAGANDWDAVQWDRRQRERRASAAVVPGVDTRADVGAPPPEPVRVVGRVTAAGAPMRAQLVFTADGAAPLSDARKCTTDADGWYAVELGPGPHRRAVVVPSERGLRIVSERIDVPRVAEHRLDLELPAGRVRGRLLSGDESVEGTEVAAWRLDAPPREDALALGAADAGGSFELAGLAPGRYQVQVDPRVADLAFRPVEVELAAGAEVEVELRGEPAGALRVAAVDAAGAPVAGARIVVVGAEGVLAARETTHADGTRLVRSLAPGTCRVFLSTPELATQGTFEVIAGAETEARLVLAPAGRLRVEVADRGGAPVAAKVTVTGGALPPALPDFQALMEGADAIDLSAVLVGPLPPGRYELTATAADGRTAARSVLVTAEGEHRVRLRLRE